MGEQAWLAARFEEERPRLRAVAYRLLGAVGEADDAVQEAWLRANRTDAAAVANLGGWLTTIVARVCLNQLQARRARREESLDLRPPEPIVGRAEGADPEEEAILGDAVGLALLVVLESLAPAEREARPAHVNGAPGIVAWDRAGRPFSVLGFTVAHEKIVAIDAIADPERLARLDLRAFDPASG